MGSIIDNELAAKVSEALARDPQLQSASIVWVDVDSGVIQLRGTVDSRQQAERALEVARVVPGVKRVMVNFTVEPESKTNDEEIAVKAERAIAKAPGITQKEVGVLVADGIATLVGRVQSLAGQEAAVRAVRAVPGIKQVVSNLAIGAVPPEEATAVVDNPLLKGWVSEAIAARGVEIVGDATVVDDGVAYLRGRVDSDREKALAEQAASQVDGIKGVRNELSIE